MPVILKAFFEPATVRQRVIKWSVIALLLALGIGTFFLQYDALRAFQKAAKNPVYVHATMDVHTKGGILTFGLEYVVTLSYECDGKQYEGVYYKSRMNEYYMQYDGKETTVAVNPENPCELVENMYNPFWNVIPIASGTVGLACLIYGIAIETDTFRKWRIKAAVRRYRLAKTPDYVDDVLIIWFPVVILAIVMFVLLF